MSISAVNRFATTQMPRRGDLPSILLRRPSERCNPLASLNPALATNSQQRRPVIHILYQFDGARRQSRLRSFPI